MSSNIPSGTVLTIDDMLLNKTVELFDYSPHLIGGIINKIAFIDETTLYINSLIDQVNQIEQLVYESANRILSQFLADGTLTIAVQNVVTPLTSGYINSLNNINSNLTTLNTNVSNLANSINQLQSNVNNDGNTITSFNNQYDSLNTQINTLLENLNQLIDDTASLIENFSNLLQEINSMSAQLTLLNGYPVNTFDSNLTLIVNNIQTITTGIANADTQITTNLNTLSGYETTIASNLALLTPLQDSINAIVNKTTDWQQQIQSMLIALDVISGDFDTTNTALDSENANLATLQTNVTDATTANTTNQTNNTTNINNLNSLRADIIFNQSLWQRTVTDNQTQGTSLRITGYMVSQGVTCLQFRMQIGGTLPTSGQWSYTIPELSGLIPLVTGTNTKEIFQNCLAPITQSVSSGNGQCMFSIAVTSSNVGINFYNQATSITTGAFYCTTMYICKEMFSVATATD